MKRRYTLVALALAALLVVTSTGGMSAMTAQRTVDVTVVPDEQAYLGIQTVDQTVRAGIGEVTLVELENRFATSITDVDVAVHGDDTRPSLTVDGHDTPKSLESGGAGAVTATVTCNPGNTTITETWTVSVAASGNDTSVSLERPVTVTCEPAPSQEG